MCNQRFFYTAFVILMLLVAVPATAGSVSGKLHVELETGEQVIANYTLDGNLKLVQETEQNAQYSGGIKKGSTITVSGSINFKTQIVVSLKFYDKDGRKIESDGDYQRVYDRPLSFSFTHPAEARRVEGQLEFGYGWMIVYFTYWFNDEEEEAEEGGLFGNDDDDDEEEDEGDDDDDYDYEEENWADEESGSNDYTIPLIIGGVLLGGAGAAVANNKLKKKKKKPAKEGKDNSSEDDDKQPDQLRMEIYKKFGDTLVVGDKPQQVNACIIRKPADGPEYVDMQLTQQIQISCNDGSGAQVTQDGMINQWKYAFIQVPDNGGTPPEEVVIDFRLVSEQASYTNHLHFKVQKSQIVFGQDDLTIPAFYPKAMPLPFLVMGMEPQDCQIKAEVQPCSFQENAKTHQSAKGDYSVTTRYNAKDEVWEAVITDQWDDDKFEDHTAGDLYGYKLYIEATTKSGLTVKGEQPLFRMYMGLGLQVTGGGDVGCYMEEYDPMKHLDTKAIVKRNDKQMTPAETRCWLVLYDWDEEKHKVEVHYPAMQPDGVRFVATDNEKQKMVNALGLQFMYQTTSEGKPFYVLRCRNTVLSAPNRFEVEIEIKVNYTHHKQQVNDTCRRKVQLLSQPRRQFDSYAAKDAAIKRDNELREHFWALEERIASEGLSDRLAPLVAYIHLQLEAYDADFGYDEDNRKSIFKCYHNVITGQMEEANSHALVACDNLSEVCIEYFRSMRTTLKAMPWYERLFFGAITGGLTDIAFVIVEGVGAVQDYVDEGGDNLFCAFTVGAWQATKQYLIEKGMGAAMSGVKNYVKNLGDVKATWNATYGEMKDMMLTEVNQVVSAIQYARVRYNGMLTDRLTRAAENKAKIDMAKVKNTPVKSELDEAIQYGEERARQTLDDLDITAWMAKENPTPENIRLLNQLVTRTQRDKQAMFKLKQTVRDTSWDNARSALNNTQFRRYDLVDDMMRSDLAKARNLRPNQVLVKNPTTSNKVELKNGRNVTMDRDSNYYFINEKGQVEYFEQKLTQNLYNKNYYKVCMEDSYGSGPVKIDTTGMTPQQIARVKQLEERLAKNFSQHGADQTVIQDLKWHPESYGEHDLAHVIDKVHQGEKLVNPTKVAEAMMYKGQSRFYDGQKMIAEAKKILDKNERLDMEANGISQLMEGCRQIVKTFELLNSRAVQRGSTQAVDAIPNSLRESVEIMRIMTGFGEANIKEVQRSLANIGQSLELVAQEMYRTVLKMG